MHPSVFVIVLCCAFAAEKIHSAPEPIWLVSGPRELHPAIADLARTRQAEGFDVRISANPPHQAIAECGRPPDYLLILGDALLGGDASPRWASATRHSSLYRWRAVQPETYAADPLWADLNKDGHPEFPVGRIPARTPEDIAKVVAKTLAFENRELTPSDLGLPIWGGTPAYGKLLDEGATTVLLSTVRKYAPAWSEPWMIFGNPRSPLSADGVSQPLLFNRRLAGGGFITAMIGHGSSRSFLSQMDSKGQIEYGIGHARSLDGDRPSPPHVILACDCGRFADAEQSLAETLLFASAGPVNVVAATTESHPLTNYYSALALLDELDGGHVRFGDYWQASQNTAWRTKKRLTEMLLKNAEGALEAEINIPKLKSDHLLMYALLGDPATRLPSMEPLDLEVRPDGDGWIWEVEKPAGATRLHVGLRGISSTVRIKPEDAGQSEANELFAQRNAAWQFAPIATLAADQAWRGKVSSPGRLRFVATGNGSLAVGAHDLTR